MSTKISILFGWLLRYIGVVVITILVILAWREWDAKKKTAVRNLTDVTWREQREIQGLNTKTDVVRALSTAEKYRGVTREWLKAQNAIVGPKNGSADVFSIDDKQSRTKTTFEFAGKWLVRVSAVMNNGAGYDILFGENKGVRLYNENDGAERASLSIQFYTNGLPATIAHFSDGRLFGKFSQYSDTGELLLSTNFTEPRPLEFYK